MNESNTTVAPTLNSRLASACNCAYGISATSGEYNAPKIYDAGVNWSEKPTPIAEREKGQDFGPYINACLVGLNQDGIIVAFRGTLPPAWTVASVEDWWQDIVKSAPCAAPPLPGKVHAGFWAALETLWPRVLTAVEKLVAAHPSTPIYVTGHSKGGPLASLGAARLLLANNIQADHVVTFASPYPGDKTFTASYPGSLPVTRIENYLDIVPFVPPTDTFFKFFNDVLPPWLKTDFCTMFPYLCQALKDASQWNYSALGELQFVTSSGDVVGAGSFDADPIYRLGQIIWELLGLKATDMELEKIGNLSPQAHSDTGFTRIGAAHCIACKSDNPEKYCAGGYMTGAGGDPICPSPS